MVLGTNSPNERIDQRVRVKNTTARRGVMFRVNRFLRLIMLRASSSLVRRIVVLNLAGLVALLAGFLYINQFRQGLIEARVESLLTQGEIMASASPLPPQSKSTPSH